MPVGLYTGSFDPVYRGHLTVIEAASSNLAKVVVVVATNSHKATGTFTTDERFAMVLDCCRSLRNVRVVAYGGLLIDVARSVGASVLVRGGGKEHATEKEMAYLNGCEGLRTLLIPSDPQTAFISSSQIRCLLAAGALDAVRSLVPPSVGDLMRARQGVGEQT